MTGSLCVCVCEWVLLLSQPVEKERERKSPSHHFSPSPRQRKFCSVLSIHSLKLLIVAREQVRSGTTRCASL